MLNTLKVLFISTLVLFLASCGSRTAEPEVVSSFCENIDIGSDFSYVISTIPSHGLELREVPPQFDSKITRIFNNPNSIESALITSVGLESTNIDPACLIYFSSVFKKGDGKIVYKQFIGEITEGI